MVSALLARSRVGAAVAVALALCLSPISSAFAQAPDGMVITVPNPIKDDALQQIKLKIDKAIKHK